MTGPAVVALGDSISTGVGDVVGPECPHGPGWAAHLATLLDAGAFLNLARNGARASDVVQTQLPAALGARPRLATVVVGGNDALRSDFCATAVAGDLARVVGALCDAGSAVVLGTLPAIALFELTPAPVRRVMRSRVAALNAEVHAIAASAGDAVTVLDMDAAARIPAARAWHVDRVHPSPAGHRRLAAVAARGLVGGDADDLLARLPDPPAPPSVVERFTWLAAAGVPWAVRRGHDFLPGLLRAVAAEMRTPVPAAGAPRPPVALQLSPVDDLLDLDGELAAL